MTPTEAIQALRAHNKWRRCEANAPTYNPAAIGHAIDTACDSLEESLQFVATLSTEIAALRDALAPFALHARSLPTGPDTLAVIYRRGVSSLTYGAFMTAMEALDLE